MPRKKYFTEEEERKQAHRERARKYAKWYRDTHPEYAERLRELHRIWSKKQYKTNLNIGVIEPLEGEEWRDVKGYEGLYQVSNLGRVKSLNYMNTKKEWLLKPRIEKKGTSTDLQYYYFSTRVNGKQVRLQLHRLIAEAFIPNTENKPWVDHIDTNGLNNSLDNLRWVTPEENSNNKLTVIHRNDAAFRKPVLQFDKNGNFIKEWESARAVTKELGINNSNIKKCINGKRKEAGGFVWKYAA